MLDRKISLFIILFLQFFFVTSCFGKSKVVTQPVKFSNGAVLNVEIARTKKQREKGLMNRSHLDEDSGMLFIFPVEQVLSFWMKNTYIDLDIGYFGKDRKLKKIVSMAAQKMGPLENQNLESYPSDSNCLYAIEVNKGWFKKNGIKVGDSFLGAGL